MGIDEDSGTVFGRESAMREGAGWNRSGQQNMSEWRVKGKTHLHATDKEWSRLFRVLPKAKEGQGGKPHYLDRFFFVWLGMC